MLVLGTVACRTEISSVRVVLLGGGLENHRVRTKCRDHCHFLEADLNEAARAADASREVKEQWLPGV